MSGGMRGKRIRAGDKLMVVGQLGDYSPPATVRVISTGAEIVCEAKTGHGRGRFGSRFSVSPSRFDKVTRRFPSD